MYFNTIFYFYQYFYSRQNKQKDVNVLVYTQSTKGVKKMNYVPYILEQGEGGERGYDIYSRLLKDRIIYI